MINSFAASVVALAFAVPPSVPLEPEVLPPLEFRQTPVIVVAPAPAPVGVPLAGAVGFNADGTPRQRVDRAALRAMLLRGRFAELTAFVERIQDDFERDNRLEEWPRAAAMALGTGEVRLLPVLNAWARSAPASFAPRLVRGTFWINAAFLRRGTDVWANVPAKDRAAMEDALDLGGRDLDEALRLRPKLVAAIQLKIRASRLHGDLASARRLIGTAIAACPSCFRVRSAFLATLSPRWGGSYAEMAEFVRTSVEMGPPRLRLLEGIAEVERAITARATGRYDEALQANERACRIGEYWVFLFERALTHRYLGDYAAALVDLDRALALSPDEPDALAVRGSTLARLGRFEEAARDLLRACQINPVCDVDLRELPWIAKTLGSMAWQLHREGQRAKALYFADLAVELTPMDPDLLRYRAAIIQRETTPDAASLAALEAAVRRAPEDFRTVQELDHALWMHSEEARAAALWDGFLKRSPRDGRAYLERGIARLKSSYEAARQDLAKACDLGVSEGCVRADYYPPR